jgi:hypothetical protein
MTANSGKIQRCATCGRKASKATHLYEEERHGRMICLCRTCWTIAEGKAEREREKGKR